MVSAIGEEKNKTKKGVAYAGIELAAAGRWRGVLATGLVRCWCLDRELTEHEAHRAVN